MLPIVLIHGFPLDGGMWRAQAEFLRSANGGGHRVLTPDLAGFGNPASGPAPRPEKATMEGFAEEIHQVIKGEGGKAVVGGLSMGGYVLLALLRAHPEDVAGAMLIDTRAEGDSEEARANRLKSMEEVKARGTGGLVETMIGRLVGKHVMPAAREQVRAIMGRQSAEAVMAGQSAMARRRDQTDILAQIRVPALVIVGAEDVVTPPAAARSMQARIPGSRLAEIPEAGHMAPMEQPAAVNEVLRTFLATVRG